MPPTRTNSRTRVMRWSPNLSVDRPNPTESPPSELDDTGPSSASNQTQDQQHGSQTSQYEAFRAHDLRAKNSGEKPGPNWQNDGAMKEWLELRFPQGTEAGSPYFQFLTITYAQVDRTYEVGAWGSVCDKLSRSEWVRWSKEHPSFEIDCKWAENPLYPDLSEGEEDTSSEDVDEDTDVDDLDDAVQPAPLQDRSEPGQLLNSSQRYQDATARVPDLNEDREDSEVVRPESGSSSRKRTAVDAEVDTGEASTSKRTKWHPTDSVGASDSEIVTSISRGRSQKRTATDAEIDSGESSTSKRTKRHSADSVPTMDPEIATSNSFGRSQKRTAVDAEIDTGETSTLKRTERDHDTASSLSAIVPQSLVPNPRSGSMAGSQPNLMAKTANIADRSEPTTAADSEDHRRSETSRSNPRTLPGQIRQKNTLLPGPNLGGGNNGSEPGDLTNRNIRTKTQVETGGNATLMPHQRRQIGQVVIPPPSNVLPPPPKQCKQQRKPYKKATNTPKAQPQSQYTKMHLRSGVGKRAHAPLDLFHLEMQGRREIQVAGSF